MNQAIVLHLNEICRIKFSLNEVKILYKQVLGTRMQSD